MRKLSRCGGWRLLHTPGTHLHGKAPIPKHQSAEFCQHRTQEHSGSSTTSPLLSPPSTKFPQLLLWPHCVRITLLSGLQRRTLRS